MKSKKIAINLVVLLFQNIVKIIGAFLLMRTIINIYGSSINGLSSSINGVLSYLNILDLGIGAATMYALYKPLEEKNYYMINKIISKTDSIFKKIGGIMFLIICMISFVYPLIIKSSYSNKFISEVIIICGINYILEYFFDGKYNLLFMADQKIYIPKLIFTLSYVFHTILSLILCNLKLNFIWIKMALIIGALIRIVFMNILVKKYYPWLKKVSKSEVNIISMTRDIFVQKISSLIFSSTDIILISTMIGVEEASVYAVYNLVYNGLANLMTAIVDASVGSFGSVCASKNLNGIRNAYNSFNYMMIFISSILITCWWSLIIPFVKVYTKGITDVSYINKSLGIAMGLMFALKFYRSASAVIINSMGMFGKVKLIYVIEALINLFFSYILVFNFGISGVIVGSVVALAFSSLCMLRLVFKYITLQEINYKMYIINFVTAIFQTIILSSIGARVSINSYFSFIFYGFIYLCITGITFTVVNYIFFPINIKALFNKLKNIFKSTDRGY